MKRCEKMVNKDKPLTDDEKLVIIELRKIKQSKYGELFVNLISGGTEVIVKTTNIKKIKIG